MLTTKQHLYNNKFSPQTIVKPIWHKFLHEIFPSRLYKNYSIKIILPKHLHTNYGHRENTRFENKTSKERPPTYIRSDGRRLMKHPQKSNTLPSHNPSSKTKFAEKDSKECNLTTSLGNRIKRKPSLNPSLKVNQWKYSKRQNILPTPLIIHFIFSIQIWSMRINGGGYYQNLF